jgi:UDP:flavonoid glycosyltransferase YjiC (YdhE family)
MAKSKKIVMTGGGTAGHVTPNIALMPALQEAGYEITYIGSYNGMEKELIEAQKIPYIGISSGKLRRYFDWKNFSDPFKVLKGYGQAISILRKLKPDVVFSKGGFVSVPVVLAAKHCHIPAIIHESGSWNQSYQNNTFPRLPIRSFGCLPAPLRPYGPAQIPDDIPYSAPPQSHNRPLSAD